MSSTRAAGAAVAFAVLAAGGCAPAPGQITWSIAFASDVPTDVARASVVHATIRTGDCSSTDTVYAADLASGDMAPRPPRLARGTWAFVAEATDASCSVIASDCVAVTVPATSTVNLLLRATDPYPLCAATECRSGRCGAPDGGPADAGPLDDTGPLDDAFTPDTFVPTDVGVDACVPTETHCTDGMDDDCDGATDCADSDCEGATCGATSLCCSGACVDTQTTAAHCGSCATACDISNHFDCAAGSCECTSGWTECSTGTCTHTSILETDCGTCGHACAAGQVCTSGTCGPNSASWFTSRRTTDCPSSVGAVFQYQCDPNPGLTSTGTVYGTDTYYVTSSICPAAVHVGRITAAAGGIVTVRIGTVPAPYTGSTRNGVTTLSRSSGSCSYTFDP